MFLIEWHEGLTARWQTSLPLMIERRSHVRTIRADRLKYYYGLDSVLALLWHEKDHWFSLSQDCSISDWWIMTVYSNFQESIEDGHNRPALSKWRLQEVLSFMSVSCESYCFCKMFQPVSALLSQERYRWPVWCVFFSCDTQSQAWFVLVSLPTRYKYIL